MYSPHTPFSECYFVGIGGVSMSALALFLHEHGLKVRGCDQHESTFTEKVRAAGIPVRIGEEEITEGAVVYTGAADPETHPQLLSAKRAGKTLLSRAELLGLVADGFPHVLSVAGCHGKTTCTSMLAHIFREGGRGFTCHIGGEDLDLGNYACEGEDYFITEACEFRRSFLHLTSETGIVLNTDLDHTDCYPSRASVLSAYAAFAARCRRAIVNEDDPLGRTLPHAASFGIHGGDYRAADLRGEGERYSFTVTEGGAPLVRIRLRVPGRVHVYNALAAFAAARLSGFSAEEIKRGVESFRGVKRRFERVGTVGGAPVVCDYAHHPREIAEAVRTAARLTEGRVLLVFQPHTYSRTRDLMEEFVEVLGRAEHLLLYRTFAAREKFDFAGSAAALTAALPQAEYVQSPEGLKRRLLREKPCGEDLILVLGAGDIYEIVKSILD